MANELRVSVGAKYSRGTEVVEGPGPFADFGVDITGKIVVRQSQTIGTTEEVVDVGDVSGGGYLLIINRDPTNYVQLRAASSATPFAKLAANGPPAFVPVDPSATLYAIANTAACRVEYLLVNY